MMKVGSVCLGLLGAFGLNATFQIWKPAIAQVVLDGTTGVGTVSGQVVPGAVYEIPQSLGTTADNNLFHSFLQVDLANGEQANFRIDPSISRVLTRVTGGDASTIDGILSTAGSDADFFLLNPAGLVFGPGAQLDMGGSFVGTTANAISFGNQGEFSAAAPQSPALLTVAPSALFFSASPGNISSNSVAPAQSASANGRPRFGLQVPTGESLLLVGGDVAVDGGGVASGGLLAFSGRLELGGLAVAGEVLLTDSSDGAGLQLAYPEGVPLADVSLTNNALVSVNGNGGGDLVVNADRLMGLNGGRLAAGTSGPGDAGDLVINARDIEFRGEFVGGVLSPVSSGAGNQVVPGATGNGGETRIVGDRLILSNGAQVGNSTFSTANPGDIVLQLQDSLQLEGLDSGILSTFDQGNAETRGAHIRIDARQLAIRGGAQISTSLLGGSGISGKISINAEDILIKDAIRRDDTETFSASSIISIVDRAATGKGGDIEINTNRLSIENGGDINTFLRGRGEAGNIKIESNQSVVISGTIEVFFPRRGQNITISSSIQSGILPEGIGRAGEIKILSPHLSLKRGGSIDASSSGIGNSGSIIINVDRLDFSESVAFGEINQSGSINSSVSRDGNSGGVRINARTISMRDDALIISSVLTPRESDSITTGQGGDIEITTNSLILEQSSIRSDLLGAIGQGGKILIQVAGEMQLEDSFISTGVSDQNERQLAKGTAGSIQIQAQSLSLQDSGLLAATRSQEGNAGTISIQVEQETKLEGEESFLGTAIITPGSRGKGDDINISTGTLTLEDGVSFLTLTQGKRDAGNILIEAHDRVLLMDDAELSTSTSDTGNAGDIKIESPRFEMLDNAVLKSESTGHGSGQSGNIKIFSDQFIIRGGEVTTESTNANGGNIVLSASRVLNLSNNTLISTTAGTAEVGGNGGNIDITTPFLIGLPSNNSDIISNAFSGKGGNVTIQAQGIFNFDVVSGQIQSQLRANSTNDISASSRFGQSGVINLNGPDVDPSRGTVELPGEPSDRSNQITSSCHRTTLASSFQRTGRRGIPANPSDFQTSGITQAEWAALPFSVSIGKTRSARTLSASSIPNNAIAPAEITHWQRDRQGNVVLLGQGNLAATKAHCAEKLGGSSPLNLSNHTDLITLDSYALW